MRLIQEICGDSWQEAVRKDTVARLWQRDHTLWNPDPKEISDRLGWLDLPQEMAETIPILRGLHRGLRGRAGGV